MYNTLFKNTYIGLIAVLLSSCLSSSKLKPRNFSSMYGIQEQGIECSFKVYHNSDNSSTVYFKYHSKNLLHTRKTATDSFTFSLMMEYEMYDPINPSVIVDTAVMVINQTSSPNKNKLITGSFNIKAKRGNIYTLELRSKDLKKNLTRIDYLTIDKKSATHPQNFLIKHPTGELAYSNYFREGDTILLVYNKPISNPIYLRYLMKEFPPALPPFTFDNDLLLKFDTEQTNILPPPMQDNFKYVVLDKGIHLLKLDTTKEAPGLPIICFESAFFEPDSYKVMLPVMRYITTKKEYEGLMSSTSSLLFDDFWLNITNYDEDKARLVMGEFYNRMQRANELFSSYTEGWKTDRGMIYMVYGPPTIVYRSAKSETWVYGEDDNMLSMNFSFSKIPNPLSSNDFALNRSNIYRNAYYRAVDIWRQGRVGL